MSVNSIKEQLGMEVKRHPIDQACFELCPKLTVAQRLMGYAACVGVGLILNIGSWVRLVDLVNGNPTPFVTLFTIGNIISVIGAFFLNGPYAQAVKMIGPQMRCATGAYLISMIATFIVAFHEGIKDEEERLGLILMLIVIQYLCMIWFIICSVWFLKQMVLGCCRGNCQKYCPACYEGCKCVCDALEDAKDTTVKTVKKASGKKEEKKTFFSFGNKV